MILNQSVWLWRGRRRQAARGKSRAGAKNGDCHQFAPVMTLENKKLGLRRIGWLYPIFRDVTLTTGC